MFTMLGLAKDDAEDLFITLKIDGFEATISSDFININTVTFTISITMTPTSTITVSYSPTGNSDLSYGDTFVPGFIDQTVIAPT